jgi:hypothetical protein
MFDVPLLTNEIGSEFALTHSGICFKASRPLWDDQLHELSKRYPALQQTIGKLIHHELHTISILMGVLANLPQLVRSSVVPDRKQKFHNRNQSESKSSTTEINPKAKTTRPSDRCHPEDLLQ